MSYDFPVIQQLHLMLAVISMGLITARGLGLLADAHWPMDERLRIINMGVDVMLTVTGLSLWGLLNINPIHHGWLMAKLILLPTYAALGAWTFHTEVREYRAIGFIGALLCMGLIVGVTTTRDAALGLF